MPWREPRLRTPATSAFVPKGGDETGHSPARIQQLHDRLIAYLSEALQARLPEPYYAEIGERLWVEASDRSIGPDVYVLDDERRDRPGGRTAMRDWQRPCGRNRWWSRSRRTNSSSFDNWEDFFVYPVRLPDRLPEVAIGLLPGDGDVAVDLQDVFQRSYDAGPYRRRIRYRQTEPVPPLEPEARQWAARLLAGDD